MACVADIDLATQVAEGLSEIERAKALLANNHPVQQRAVIDRCVIYLLHAQLRPCRSPARKNCSAAYIRLAEDGSKSMKVAP